MQPEIVCNSKSDFITHKLETQTLSNTKCFCTTDENKNPKNVALLQK